MLHFCTTNRSIRMAMFLSLIGCCFLLVICGAQDLSSLPQTQSQSDPTKEILLVNLVCFQVDIIF